MSDSAFRCKKAKSRFLTYGEKRQRSQVQHPEESYRPLICLLILTITNRHVILRIRKGFVSFRIYLMYTKWPECCASPFAGSKFRGFWSVASMWVTFSAGIEQKLCLCISAPPFPNTECPHIHPTMWCRDKTELKDQHSESPRSNTGGHVSGDMVTFSGGAHVSIPPLSHRWSIHHADRLLDLTSALTGAVSAVGG